LRANAVSYALAKQDASGLSFGKKQQTQPPRVGDDVAALVKKGVPVFYVEEDLAERGIDKNALHEGLQAVSRGGLAKLFAGYDCIWHW